MGKINKEELREIIECWCSVNDQIDKLYNYWIDITSSPIYEHNCRLIEALLSKIFTDDEQELIFNYVFEERGVSPREEWKQLCNDLNIE